MSLIKRLPFGYAANPRNRNQTDVLALAAARGCVDYEYLPTKLANLFQDVNGATPVTTVGQSIAMMYGNRYAGALGSELCVNGDFSSAVGWTTPAGWAIAAGVANHTTSSTGMLIRAITLGAGKTYRVTYTVTSFTSGTVQVRFQTGVTISGTVRSAAGTYTETLSVLGTVPSNLAFATTGTAVLTIDNVSVKEIQGYNPAQATGASQPTYQVDARGYPLRRYDAVDDLLATPTGLKIPALPHYVCAVFSRSALGAAANAIFGSFLNANGHSIASRGTGLTSVSGRFNDTATPSGGTGSIAGTGGASPIGSVVCADSLVISGTTDLISNANVTTTAANTWVGGDTGTASVSLVAEGGAGNGPDVYTSFVSWGYAWTPAERLAIRRSLMKEAGYDI